MTHKSMKIKEVDKDKCMTCGNVFKNESLPELPQEKGKCVYSQCAECFLNSLLLV